MRDMLKGVYFGGFIECDIMLTCLNFIVWFLTLLVAMFIYICLDTATGDHGISEKSYVTSIEFIPEHNQLIGKVITIVEDEWFVSLSNEVTCESSIDYFNIGDFVEVTYTKGRLSNSKYCETIKKVN